MFGKRSSSNNKKQVDVYSVLHEFSYRGDGMESPFTDIKEHLFAPTSENDFFLSESQVLCDFGNLNEKAQSGIWAAREAKSVRYMEWLIKHKIMPAYYDNPDYLCIGCSCTSAWGLPIEYSWPMIIAAFTGKKVNNFGRSGTGIDFQCSIAIASSVRYGMPENVLAMFPDPYRMWMPAPTPLESTIGDNVRGSREIPQTEHRHTVHSAYHTYDETYKTSVKGIGHRTTTLESIAGTKHIFPPASAVQNSLIALRMLDTYCSLSNINFSFSSWSFDGNLLLNSINEIATSKSYKRPIIVSSKNNAYDMLIDTRTNFKSAWREAELKYSIIGDASWRRMGCPGEDNTCDHEPQTHAQEKFWHVASDNSHPGLHDQIHYAEHLLSTPIGNDLLKVIK